MRILFSQSGVGHSSVHREVPDPAGPDLLITDILCSETTMYCVGSASNLDEMQEKAVKSPAKPLVIVAGAGSGKTTTLVRRVAYICQKGWVQPHQVLAVTHTTKSAAELKHRLSSLDPALAAVQCHTIHAAAWRIYSQFYALAGDERQLNLVKSTFGMVKEAHLVSARSVTVENEKVLDLMAEIEVARANGETSASYQGWALRQKRQTSVTYLSVVETWDAYEKLKTKHGVLDFADVLEKATFIVEHTPAGDTVRDRWRSLVVDEYQDTDIAQERLLNALRNGRDLHAVVGDPRQTIYSFKGANKSVLERSMKEPGATVVHLTASWRCANAIVELANKVIGKSYGPALTAPRAGGAWSLEEAATEADELDAIIDKISEWRSKGIAHNKIAVLYRFNSQQGRIEAALAQHCVPFQTSGGESFLKKKELIEILTPFGKHARQKPDENGVDLIRKIAYASGFDPEKPPAGAGAQRMRWENTNALLELCETSGHDSAGELLSYLLELVKSDHHNGVVVSTVHAAKGLEYDAVVVAGVMEGQFPSVYSTSIEDIEEERRLLYVAITRAKNELLLTGSLLRGKRRGKLSRHLVSVAATRKLSPSSSKSTAAYRPSAKLAAELDAMFECGTCHRKLSGASARQVKRCSGPCLTGDMKKKWVLAKNWRDGLAISSKVTPEQVASDRSLFHFVVTGEKSRGFQVELPSLWPAD